MRELVGVNSVSVLLTDKLWVGAAANKSNAKNAVSADPRTFMKTLSVTILH